MTISVEDSWSDVLQKAASGLKLDPQKIAAQLNLPQRPIEDLFLRDKLDLPLLTWVAPLLGLNPEALARLAQSLTPPDPISPPRGLLPFQSPFGDLTVNSFLVWDPSTHKAATFDTGTDCDPILHAAAKLDLKITQIFLTHSHGDHIIELDRLIEKTGATARICQLEPLEGAQPFAPGDSFSIGTLKVSTSLTPGHSPGGITYTISGLSQPIAIVGDALFARSVGRIRQDYHQALDAIRQNILNLPPDTLLCPGHGPLTTVASELAHNPFFAH